MPEGMLNVWEDQFGFTMEDYEVLKTLKSKKKGWKTERRMAQSKLNEWLEV